MTFSVDQLENRLAGMLGFLDRYTASSGTYLMDSQKVVRNALHSEIGRGGYFPTTSSTSEAQITMIRGLLAAHRATGDLTYLTRAKQLVEALIDYFYFNVEPPSSSGIWPHHWLVNAGPEVISVRGPSADPYTSMGNIAVPVAFTAGVAALGSNLSIVFKVFTGDPVWTNVFAALQDGGVEYPVDYYIDSLGRRCSGQRGDGSWGDVIGAVTGEPAGKIVLVDTSHTGTLKVNSADLDGTTIPVNSGFEAWPMWRALVGPEVVSAPDGLHWAVDIWRRLISLEPGEVRWQRALARTLDTWLDACTYRVSTDIFKSEIGALYNSWPLTYLYGVRGATSFQAGDPSVTASRDGSGVVVFDLDADGLRTEFVFENGSLFVETTSISAFEIDVGADVAVDLEIRVLLDDATTASAVISLAGTGLETFSIPRIGFRNWPSPIWRASDGGSFVYGTGAESSTTGSDGTSTWPVRRVTVGDNSSGWGFAYPPLSMPITALVQPRSGATTVRLTDGDGWFWYLTLTNTGALSEVPLDWTNPSWTTTGYQEVIGTPPASPVGSTATAFIIITGSTTEVDLAWVGPTAPTVLAAGRLEKVSLSLNHTGAIQLLVADASFSASVRDAIAYQTGVNRGVVPFNYGAYGGGRRGAGGALFQGPIYAVYQSVLPWWELGDTAAATLVYACLNDAQAAYTTSVGITGPFCPVYIPATWESAAYGSPDTWTWNGPDPNTFWGGFQYRTYLEAARGWSLFASAIPNAATVTNRFLLWLDTWLTANPSATGLPTEFREAMTPAVTYDEPHFLALAVKATACARLAGADPTRSARVLSRLLDMLEGWYAPDGTLMAGSFATDPDVETYYGFWHGEIMTALADTLYDWPSVMPRRRPVIFPS